MTVATCVMLLELTNNLALLPLMMLVTLVAKVCCCPPVTVAVSCLSTKLEDMSSGLAHTRLSCML